MKNSFYLAVLSAAIFASACQPEKKKITEEYPEPYETTKPFLEPTQAELIQRGKYLVTAVGCSDCHSPKIMTEHGPEPDPARLLSGHDQNEKLPLIDQDAIRRGWTMFSMGFTSAVGPWGVSFAANLTPDETGIGAWTFDNFKTAIRKGKYKGIEGGRDLLPPMPWQMYRNMTDDDLKSIYTYLKSLPKIDNLVPLPIPPQPEKIAQKIKK